MISIKIHSQILFNVLVNIYTYHQANHSAISLLHFENLVFKVKFIIALLITFMMYEIGEDCVFIFVFIYFNIVSMRDRLIAIC